MTISQTSKYKCSECKDTEWIFVDRINCRPCKCREVNQARRIIEASGITEAFNSKTIRDYIPKNDDQRRAKSISIDYVQNFNSIRETRNNSIMLLGQPGSGKSHLTIAIANALLKNGTAVRYMQYREAMTSIKQVMTDEAGYARIMSPLKNTSVLLLDDLYKGIIRNGKANESELSIMFDLINHRYLAEKPMMISSELSLDEILEMDEATGSRLSEMAKGRTVELIGKELNHRMA